MKMLLGLDAGVASVGWAVILGNRIVAAGTRMFDAPETDKERRPKSELRRVFRGQRRVIRRRSQRMRDIRSLFHGHGLLTNADSGSLRRPGLDPWKLRARGLDHLLSAEELAVALGHIARHRGFRSNSKKQSNQPDDESEMKRALARTQERLQQWRTVGEMLYADPTFGSRKRNREGDYTRTPLRDDLEAEADRLFRAQRRLLSPSATEALQQEFNELAFEQRGLRDSEDKVAECAFEPNERRAAKRSYSFERYRYLRRLAALRVGADQRPLTADELQRAMTGFGSTKKITFKALRKLIELPDSEPFATVKPEEETRDVVARHGEAAHGAGTLFKLLEGSAWQLLVKTPEKLDRIAEVISFRSDLGRIEQGLSEIGLSPLVVDALVKGVKAEVFEKFTGAGNISAKACRHINERMLLRRSFEEACEDLDYDPTASRERNAFNLGSVGKDALSQIIKKRVIDQALVGSPVARKALLEALKQARAVIEEYGLPDEINVELARDVGKSIDERKKIERGIERRNKDKERLREWFEGDLGRPPASAEELLKYELWREQNGRCIYSGQMISPLQITSKDNEVEIDHILPWSRFGDDSFNNKTLCLTRSNQGKRNFTPYEWLKSRPADWELYVARVNSLAALKRHKRKLYTIKDVTEFEKRFRSRNLNDTRWASRLLAEALKSMYPADEAKRRVFTRPGSITDRLRRAWGLQSLKKDEKGKRIPDDRHHANDAIIIAATTESQLQLLTEAFKNAELEGKHRDFGRFNEPWRGFRDEARTVVSNVFVSRAERRRARGKAHDATVRQIRPEGEQEVIYERKPIEKLTEQDLDRIPVPEGYGNAVDPQRLRDKTVEALRVWIAAEKPSAEDQLPRSPKGDIIRKVRVATSDLVAIRVRGGAVERGDMARIDVFRKRNKKGAWQFFLVPIYPHEIAGVGPPPDKAVPGSVPLAQWPGIGEPEFMFSIGSMSLVEVVKPDGEAILAYFRSLDRNTGAINLSPHENMTIVRRSIGARTLKSFKKFTVDRLGRKFEVKREQRTWRGKTLPDSTRVPQPIVPPIQSSPVASSVSSVHGVEGPASDAAD